MITVKHLTWLLLVFSLSGCKKNSIEVTEPSLNELTSGTIISSGANATIQQKITKINNVVLANPTDVFVDSLGNIFIADGTIKKITPQGTTYTYNVPGLNAYCICPGGNGKIIYSDPVNHKIGILFPNLSIGILAGTGVPGYSGDGGMGNAAQINSPFGVVMDSLGNVFFSDFGNSRIRRISPFGQISTIAGNGNSNYAGEGVGATNGQLAPTYLAIDKLGNLYVSDFYNNRIRKITSSGIIKTIAGTGIAGFSGDGGYAINAQIYQPAGIKCYRDGSVYFCDKNQRNVRIIDNNSKISTIIKGGVPCATSPVSLDSAGLDQPSGIFVSSPSTIFVTDPGCQVLRKTIQQ